MPHALGPLLMVSLCAILGDLSDGIELSATWYPLSSWQGLCDKRSQPDNVLDSIAQKYKLRRNFQDEIGIHCIVLALAPSNLVFIVLALGPFNLYVPISNCFACHELATCLGIELNVTCYILCASVSTHQQSDKKKTHRRYVLHEHPKRYIQ